MLKLKLQYFGHLIWRTDSFEKTLMLGKIEGRKRRDNRGWNGWMIPPTQWTWVWVNSGSWRGTGRSQRVRHDWVTELNWNCLRRIYSYFKEFLHPWRGKINLQDVSASCQSNIAQIDEEEAWTKKAKSFDLPADRVWLQDLKPNSELVGRNTSFRSLFLWNSLWACWTGNGLPGTPAVKWHASWHSFMELTLFGKQMTTRHSRNFHNCELK